ncbi:MAG TPA: MFS transporter [Treponemataceae bacterium]|nr:MFS transporter [Treponemataceae bacterium]
MIRLLVIVYITFISLGLPDAILGPAWPVLHLDLGVNVAYAGFISMIISAGTVASSLLSERVILKWKIANVTTFSVLLTAIGLIGFALSQNFITMCFFAIPLGIGAGAIDSGLNNFVATHYKAIHMNWLHAFWGIGATAGPIILSFFILRNNGWRISYALIAGLQCTLVVFLFLTLPLWERAQSVLASNTEGATAHNKKKNVCDKNTDNTYNEKKENEIGISRKNRLGQLLKLPGAKPALVAFFCYCTVELIAGMWGATYLVHTKNLSAEIAAQWIAIYYLGITAGRILAGFVALKLTNNQLIRIGQLTSIIGVLCMFISGSNLFQLLGFILLGLGCAPIYPAMLHETPVRFGKKMSQGIMGIQMATAYIGTTIMPPLFGFVAGRTSFTILPFVLVFILLVECIVTEIVTIQITGARNESCSF